MLLALGGSAALMLLVVVVNAQQDGDPLGANDFVQYWSAFRIASEGGDPYDAAAMMVVQAEVGLEAHADEPLLFWNPPWVLLVLAPVLALPFELANAAFLTLNIALCLICAWCGWRLFGPPGLPVPPVALASSLLFLPFLEALAIGQLGVVIAALVLGALVAIRSDRPVLAGVLLGLWSIKPQSLILVALVLGVHLLAYRSWRLLSVAAGTVLGLYLTAAAILPTATRSWAPLQGPTDWHTATVAGWVRWLMRDGGEPATWPLVAVPLVAVAAMAPAAVMWRDRIPWQHLPLIIGVSVVVAPHAFIYDAVALVAVQVVLVGTCVRGLRCYPLIVLVAVQVGAAWLRSLPDTGFQHLVWVPVAIAGAWAWYLAQEEARHVQAEALPEV